MAGILEGARKAKEKAVEKKDELTRQAADKADELKTMTAEASTALKTQIAEETSEIREAGASKLSGTMEELNSAIPVLNAAGYSLHGVRVKLGVPPAISVDFDITGEVSEERINQLVESEEKVERKTAALLLKSLLQARKVQSKIKVKGLEPIGVSVNVAFIPEIAVKFGRRKDSKIAPPQIEGGGESPEIKSLPPGDGSDQKPV